MYNYHIFGINVRSDRPVWGLAEAVRAGPADVSLHLSGDPLPPVGLRWSHRPSVQTGRGNPRLECSTAPGVAGTFLRLRYQSNGRFAAFVIDPGGRYVWGEWSEGASEGGIADLLVGQVLCAVLLVRGVTCLHASAVAIDGRAVAFIGHPGAGKSTTAAALRRRGCLPLTDDLVALTENLGDPPGHDFLVHAGYCGLSLRQDAARALCGAGDTSGPIGRGEEGAAAKFYFELDPEWAASARRPIPLAGIYLLEARGSASSSPAVVTVPGADRLMSLAPHARAGVLLGEEERARDFAALGRLAATVPLRRVRRPDGLASLAEVCDTILEDVASLPGRSITRRC